VKKVALRTVNLELANFRAVFNELARMGECKDDNPIKNVSPFRTEESEMAFLTKEQIGHLLEECARENNNDLVCIVKLCLSTGARWSEAEELNKSQVTKYKVTYTKTKGRKIEPSQSVKHFMTLFQKLKKVDCSKIATVLFVPLWNAQISIYLPANLRMYYATLLHLTL